jgi:hypothetical protein
MKFNNVHGCHCKTSTIHCNTDIKRQYTRANLLQGTTCDESNVNELSFLLTPFALGSAHEKFDVWVLDRPDYTS